MWGPTIPVLKQRFEAFQAAATKAQGQTVTLGARLALLRDTYVADTMEQARRESEKSIVESYQWILGRRQLHDQAEHDPGERRLPVQAGWLLGVGLQERGLAWQATQASHSPTALPRSARSRATR
jgi:hypothetical protein